jgi:teichuronic acid exporter
VVTNLKAQALHAVFWSFLQRVGQQGIQFVIALILARLLLPTQFGLVGMLTIFMELARVFIDSGFGAALVQRQETTGVEESSMFYFNVLVGLLAAGLLCAASPWIARFYGQPILVPLTCALSVTLVLHSLAAVQTALLTKRIDFKTLLKVSMSASALSGTIGIVMALRGCGVWSLVGQYIAASFFRTLLLWRLNTWRPRLVFHLAALRVLFRFGSCLLASSLLNTFFENIYLVVIGRLFAPAQLGLYSGARRIQRMATLNITGVVTQVAFPVFAMIQDDPVRLKRSMRKAMATLALVNFPVMAGLALTARPLVYVLLTEKWAACIPWMQLLCVAGLLYPFQSLHLNVLKAQGRSDLLFMLEIIKKVLVVILIVATYRWGVTGLIWGQVIMSGFGYYINSYYTSRLIHYRLWEQLADLAPYAAVTVLMALGLHAVQLLPLAGDKLLLSVMVLLGILLYVLLSYAFHLSAFLEMARAIRERWRSYALSPAGS